MVIGIGEKPSILRRYRFWISFSERNTSLPINSREGRESANPTNSFITLYVGFDIYKYKCRINLYS